MPEVQVSVGGRSFAVACQDGEEPYLEAAAQMLDREAQTLLQSGARMPADRMLLMAGLMLADRTISADDELRAMDRRLAEQSKTLDDLRARPEPEPPEPVVREVVRPVVPSDAVERVDGLAGRLEAVAGKMAG